MPGVVSENCLIDLYDVVVPIQEFKEQMEMIVDEKMMHEKLRDIIKVNYDHMKRSYIKKADLAKLERIKIKETEDEIAIINRLNKKLGNVY